MDPLSLAEKIRAFIEGPSEAMVGRVGLQIIGEGLVEYLQNSGSQHESVDTARDGFVEFAAGKEAEAVTMRQEFAVMCGTFPKHADLLEDVNTLLQGAGVELDGKD